MCTASKYRTYPSFFTRHPVGEQKIDQGSNIARLRLLITQCVENDDPQLVPGWYDWVVDYGLYVLPYSVSVKV